MVPRGMKHDMFQGCVSKPLLLKGHMMPLDKIVSQHSIEEHQHCHNAQLCILYPVELSLCSGELLT